MELEAGDSGVRSLVSVQGSLAMFAIWRWGSEEQKQRWLPPMHDGDAIGCFGLTEPDAGSDPARCGTTARRDGGDWILNGTKMWITNGTIADVAVVWARTDSGEINGFLVERGDGRASRRRDEAQALAARFRDVRSSFFATSRPDENRFPEVDEPARAAVVPERGALRDRLGRRRRGARVLRGALDYAQERIVFGKPISGYQLTQQKLAEMALEVNRGTLVALHLGRMKDEGRSRPSTSASGRWATSAARSRSAAARARSSAATASRSSIRSSGT
jgi:glutaryl-CoA dehydrogenase